MSDQVYGLLACVGEAVFLREHIAWAKAALLLFAVAMLMGAP